MTNYKKPNKQTRNEDFMRTSLVRKFSDPYPEETVKQKNYF